MCCKCCSPKVATILRSIYAIVGILIGLLICVVFSVVFENKGAAYLGLTSSVFAAVCLVQFIYLYVKTEVRQSRPHLYVLCTFGAIGAIGISVGLGAMVTFLGLGIMDSINHIDLSLPRTHYIAVVWAFANFKWGLTAFVYALKTFHKLFVRSCQFQPLVEDGSSEDHE